jgi:hypothetical protein
MVSADIERPLDGRECHVDSSVEQDVEVQDFDKPRPDPDHRGESDLEPKYLLVDDCNFPNGIFWAKHISGNMEWVRRPRGSL